MRRASLLETAGIVAALACRPDLGGGDALVTSPQVLAVKAEPPEAPPGKTATYAALVAGGPDAGPGTVVWRFCTAPKLLDEDNAVSPACLDAASLVGAGAGSPATLATPSRACFVFGPDTTSAGARPPDADVTGGYYQPLRADLAGADPTFYLVRIQCGLAGASADVVTQFAEEYVPNQNPHLQPLVVTTGGIAADPSHLPAGARVQLTASWPPEDAETYAYFDPSTQALTTRREAMSVSWHADSGSFDTESTGRSETDVATTTVNTWTAPLSGPVHLWVVLRDSRGGVDFTTVDVAVP